MKNTWNKHKFHHIAMERVSPRNWSNDGNNPPHPFLHQTHWGGQQVRRSMFGRAGRFGRAEKRRFPEKLVRKRMRHDETRMRHDIKRPLQDLFVGNFWEHPGLWGLLYRSYYNSTGPGLLSNITYRTCSSTAPNHPPPRGPEALSWAKANVKRPK